ncbi:MAG: peptidyl-prolyl cis-trans isomerase [Candidatus Zixiibacteriota bacterium]|jgi:peptidyl-prolyl cis-trans isomerase SurA
MISGKAFPAATILRQALACVLFFCAAAAAERRPLDGVVAVVNNDVILASELGEEVSVRLYQLGPGAAKVGDVRKYTAEVLAEMIDARLLVQDADDHDILVSKDDIQPYLDEELTRIKGAFGSPEAYEAALAEYGMTEKDLIIQYRKSLRDQFKIRRLTEMVLAPRVNVREEEIRGYYDGHRDELAIPAVVTLREVAIAKRPSDESLRAVKSKLEAVRNAALAGGDFGALAKELAEREGGEFGASFKYEPGEAVPALERAAKELRPGGISAVTPGPEGYWLVRLVGRENAKREVQYIHLKVSVTDADIATARRQAEAAAAALARGESFDDVAAKYSDNEETASRGGLVGELGMDEIEAQMPGVAAVLNEMDAGDVTPVIERPEGFFVLKIDAREEGREVSYEDARERIKRLLTNQKLALEQKKYLQELKEKAYIRTFE